MPMPADSCRSPSGSPVEEYLAVAERTGAFRLCEIEILREVLVDVFVDPAKGYCFLENRENGRIAAFAVFGRAPMTEWAWDLYWIVVDRPLQGRGFGKRLLGEIENAALASTGKVILRVETSGRQEYEGQRHFYLRTGFHETGRIPDFYEAGDDLVTYCKFLSGGPDPEMAS
jgi:ribosomal protein S18 acetylase RimI-like enzyme